MPFFEKKASKTLFVGGIYEVDKNSSGTVTGTKTYYPAGDAMRIGSTLYYVLKDHLGSSSVVTDASGNTVGEDRFYPFGQTRLTTGTMYTDKLYTGQRQITGLGIYDYGARFYSPYINRFISADPVVPRYANPQSLNRYSYTLNNPLRYTDPTGNRICEDYQGSCVSEDQLTQSLLQMKKHAPVKVRSGYNIYVPVSAGNGPYINIPTSGYQLPAGYTPLAGGPLINIFVGVSDNNGFEGFDPVSNNGQLKVLAESESTQPTPVQPYDVGPYADLKARSSSGDALQIHHAPQGNPAGQVINGYNYPHAPAIVLPDAEHFAVNAANLQGPYNGTARDLLAKTILDLRNYTNAPNSALQELININKNMYPGAYGI